MLGWTQLHYATARSDRDAVARLLAICRLGCKARPSCGDPCPRLQGLYSIYVCICIYRVHFLVKPKKVIRSASSGDIGQAPGGSQARSFFGGTLADEVHSGYIFNYQRAPSRFRVLGFSCPPCLVELERMCFREQAWPLDMPCCSAVLHGMVQYCVAVQ